MDRRAVIGILIGLGPITLGGVLLLAGRHLGVDLSPPGPAAPHGTAAGNVLFLLGMVISAVGILWLIGSLMWFRVFSRRTR